MKCCILVSKGAPISSVLGPYEMLMLANSLVDDDQQMELELVAAEQVVNVKSDFEFRVNKIYTDVPKCDCVIIAPLGRVSSVSLQFNPSMIAWLKQQYEQGGRLVSLCTGAFLLAETGFLDGKAATTHWQYDDVFIKRYPNVLLRSNEVICQQGRLSSSGGANAYQDMVLNIIGDHFGTEIKIKCAKLLMLDFTRKSQQMYRTPDKVRRHLDEKVHMLQDWIQEHLAESFKMDVLAKKAHLSERQIKRKFVSATGMAPLNYVQYMRVEQAKEVLLETNWSVEKISYTVGYQDVRFFRALFKRYAGISPSQYRQTFA